MNPRLALRVFNDINFVGEQFLWLAVEGSCLIDDIGMPASTWNDIQAAVTEGHSDSPDNDRYSFWSDKDVWDSIPKAVSGLVCLFPKGAGPRLFSRFKSYYESVTFDKLVAAGLPSSYTREHVENTWLGWPCPSDEPDCNHIFGPPHHPYNTYSFDAMSSFIAAISDMLAEDATRTDIAGDALLEALKNIQFEGLTGATGFDPRGDRLAPFEIYNLRYDVGSDTSALKLIGGYDGATGVVSFDEDVIFADGTTTHPLDRSAPCLAGEAYDIDAADCVLCPPGSYTPTDDSRTCIPCAAGSATSSTGATACKQCEAGQWSKREGAESCVDCDPGHYSAAVGMTQCELCQPGFYSGTAAVGCSLCAEGSYSEKWASSECEGCVGGTTSPRASDSKDMCVCKEGSYLKFQNGDMKCIDCVEGLNCPRGVAIPTQEAGFYAEVTDTTSRDIRVFKCNSVSKCVAGELGSCSEPYSGRSCARCGKDAVNTDHECGTCPGWAIFMIVLILIIGLVMGYLICDRTKYGQATIFFMIGGNLAIVVATVQGVYIAFSFFPELEVNPAIESLTAIAMFRFADLQDTCGFGQSFAARLGFISMFPIYVIFGYVVLGAIAWPIHLVLKTTIKPDVEPAINASGVFFQALYVLLCKQAVSFFVGKKHFDPSAPVTLAD
jgi:hypothetical protein